MADCVMSGAAGVGYTRGLFRNFAVAACVVRGRHLADGPTAARLCPRVLPTMEINPILNSIKDLSERTLSIRGYL